MELGNFQKSVDSDEIKTMAFEIIGEPVKAVSRICEQWGEAEDEVREYDVYVIETDAGKYEENRQQRSADLCAVSVKRRVSRTAVCRHAAGRGCGLDLHEVCRRKRHAGYDGRDNRKSGRNLK